MADFSTVVVTQNTQAVVLSTVQQVVQVNSAIPGSYLSAPRLGFGIYSVKDPAYGAVGDGVTDDTTAIRAAIAAVPLGGGVVFFPAGIYLVSGTLTIPVDRTVSLVGVQQGARLGSTDTIDGSILRRHSSFSGTLIQQEGVLTPRTAQGLRAAHLVLDGQGLAGDLMFIDFGQNVQLDDVKFCQASGHALKAFGFINAWVRECRFMECGSATKAAVWLDYSVAGAVNSASNHWIACEWENNRGIHLYLANENDTSKIGTTDVQILGGKFEQTGIPVPVGLPIIKSTSTSHSYINAVFSGGDHYDATHLLFAAPGGSSSGVSSRRVVVDGRFTVFSGTDADNPQYLVDVVEGSDIVIRGAFHHGGGNGGAQIRIASQSVTADQNGPGRIFLDPSNTYSAPLSGKCVEGIPTGPFGVSADQGDASKTAVWGADPPTLLFQTTLTANRTVTLSKTSGSGVFIPPHGARFRIVRTGLGNFTLTILNGAAGTTLITLPAGTSAYAECEYNGTDWVLVGTGGFFDAASPVFNGPVESEVSAPATVGTNFIAQNTAPADTANRAAYVWYANSDSQVREALRIASGFSTITDATRTTQMSIQGQVAGVFSTLLSFLGTAADFPGTAEAQRFIGGGTAHAATDYALSAGWGNTATVSTVTALDTGGRVSITCNGSGIAANPTVTLTFKDGTWGSVPVVVVSRGDINAPATAVFVRTTASATAPTFTFLGTPVAGTIYTFDFVTMGR